MTSNWKKHPGLLKNRSNSIRIYALHVIRLTTLKNISYESVTGKMTSYCESYILTLVIYRSGFIPVTLLPQLFLGSRRDSITSYTPASVEPLCMLLWLSRFAIISILWILYVAIIINHNIVDNRIFILK